MKNDKIAVLLTVFNRKQKTLDCLQSLYQQEGLSNAVKVDVYLVDDGSTDGTSQAIISEFPEVNIITGNGSLFWNRGMYLAWKTASESSNYDYFLWLNDDTIIKTNALNVLLQCSTLCNNQAIIVGTTISKRSSRLTYGGRNTKGSILAPGNNLKECDFFNGNIVLVPFAVYSKVGMNDPFFRHSLGDFDYGFRAKKLGFKSFVATEILGFCEAHDTLPIWCNPDKTLSVRWKAFRTPLGQNPEQFFVYEMRHNGFFTAVFHYITNHLRVLLPVIWR